MKVGDGGGGGLQDRGGVRRQRGGARGPADQFALRELHRGKSNSLPAPFYPEKCLATVRYLRALLAPVPLAKDDDKFRAAVKSGALSLFLERRSRGGHLPGKGSDRIGSDRTRGLRELD